MKISLEFWKKYRYPLIIGLFLFWITFFDSYSLLSYWRINRESKTLKKEANFYKKEIEEARQKRDYLFTSPTANTTHLQNLEKFAREQYFMKKDDEDVFIILERPKEK
jgi:cell division protein FtsB